MNRTTVIVLSIIGGIVLIALLTIGWGISVYNRIITTDESIRSNWSQVENQYQRRFDLIPNLVETVKGYAKQEREVFENVTNARAKVGQLSIPPDILNNPAAFERFQSAQDGLGSALSRLLAIVENYPVLKSNENFLTLQSQLEGTENRIAVERRRFNESVQAFNTLIRRFPASVIAGMTGFGEAVYFKATVGAEEAPKVQF